MEPFASPRDLSGLFADELAEIFGFLLVRSGSRALAEDLTSQTFLAASERFAAGRGDEVTPAWLQTVARRRLIDHWRSRGAQNRRMQKLRGFARDEVPPPPDPHDDVLDALDSLPDRQRAVLVLRYLDDFSLAEVAEALGSSYKATESLLARAKRSFRAAYKGEDL